MANKIGLVVLAVSTLLPWAVIITALGAWGTEPSDLVIVFMTTLTFLIAGIGFGVGERARYLG